MYVRLYVAINLNSRVPSFFHCCVDRQKVIDVVGEQLGKKGSVEVNSNFIDDLDADSLDTIELIMSLEEEFGVSKRPRKKTSNNGRRGMMLLLEYFSVACSFAILRTFVSVLGLSVRKATVGWRGHNTYAVPGR